MPSSDVAASPHIDADQRAFETERQMTDEERFGLIGYRWFAQHGHRPRYAFGYGLSYTTFAYSDLVVHGGDTITTSFAVTNTGGRAGAEVAQLYLTAAPGEQRRRLLAFERVELPPGDSRRLTLMADPRLLARLDGPAGRWVITPGAHHIAVASSAETPVFEADIALEGRQFAP